MGAFFTVHSVDVMVLRRFLASFSRAFVWVPTPTMSSGEYSKGKNSLMGSGGSQSQAHTGLLLCSQPLKPWTLMMLQILNVGKSRQIETVDDGK